MLEAEVLEILDYTAKDPQNHGYTSGLGQEGDCESDSGNAGVWLDVSSVGDAPPPATGFLQI